jgi:hypothetical protein
MNNGLRQPFEKETEDAGLGESALKEEQKEHATLMTFMVSGARSRMVMDLPDIVQQKADEINKPPPMGQAPLDRGIVDDSFWISTIQGGITVVELCAGIASGLGSSIVAGH